MSFYENTQNQIFRINLLILQIEKFKKILDDLSEAAGLK